MTIPFYFEKNRLIERKKGGTLELRGDHLVFRTDTAEEPLHLPLTQIKYISFEPQLLGAKITIHTLKREFAAAFTGEDDVSFTLNIKKAQASEAESFVRFLKLRLAETIVRGLSENPYEQ